MTPLPSTNAAAESPKSVAQLVGVRLHYRKKRVLDGIDLEIPGGCMVGLIGPDGVGKSSLLALLAGARAVQEGSVTSLGGDMRDKRHRKRIGARIAYMPQGLGRIFTLRCRWRRICNSSPGCLATEPANAAAVLMILPAERGCCRF